MRSDLTDLTIVVDRSGSMSSCKYDAEGGLNELVNQQKSEEGECTFSLLEFDDEFNWVYNGVNVKDVGPYTLNPRNMTALHDAIGMAINKTGERLAALPEKDRPELVIIAIVTDGLENRSREYNQAKISEMVKHQTDKYNWKFTFIGANQDAVLTGGQLGFSSDAALSYNTRNTSDTYEVFTKGITSLRSAVRSGVGAQNVSFKYSDEDRSRAMGEKEDSSAVS